MKQISKNKPTDLESVGSKNMDNTTALVIFITDDALSTDDKDRYDSVVKSWKDYALWAEIIELKKSEINAVPGAEILTTLSYLSVNDLLNKDVIIAPLKTELLNEVSKHDFAVIKTNSVNNSIFGIVPNVLDLATLSTTLEVLSNTKKEATDNYFETEYLKKCNIEPRKLFGNIDCHFSVFLKNPIETYPKDKLDKFRLERKIAAFLV